MRCHVLHAQGSYAVAVSGMKLSSHCARWKAGAKLLDLLSRLRASGSGGRSPAKPCRAGRPAPGPSRRAGGEKNRGGLLPGVRRKRGGGAAPMSSAQAPARAAAAGANLSAGIAASAGRGRLPSSVLLLRRGAGPCSARILRGRLCACRRAYRGGAARAPDCAREAEGAPLPSASHGFSESGAARPRNARDAAPDSASPGTIITQSARCQAKNTNKSSYIRFFSCFGKDREGCQLAGRRARRGILAGLSAPPMESPCSGGGELSDLDRLAVLLRVPEVVLHLLGEPAFGAASKRLGQPDRHFGRNAEPAVEQQGKRIARYRKTLRRLGHRQAQGFEAPAPDESAGMGGSCMSMGAASTKSPHIVDAIAFAQYPPHANGCRQEPTSVSCRPGRARQRRSGPRCASGRDIAAA